MRHAVWRERNISAALWAITIEFVTEVNPVNTMPTNTASTRIAINTSRRVNPRCRGELLWIWRPIGVISIFQGAGCIMVCISALLKVKNSKVVLSPSGRFRVVVTR